MITIRIQQGKFSSPMDFEIPVPSMGISYVDNAKADFNYCRDANNMWLDEDGNIETRPAIVNISKKALGATAADIEGQGGRISAVFYSPMFDSIFFAVNGTIDINGAWLKGPNRLYRIMDGTIRELGDLYGDNEFVSIVEFINPLATGGTIGLAARAMYPFVQAIRSFWQKMMNNSVAYYGTTCNYPDRIIYGTDQYGYANYYLYNGSAYSLYSPYYVNGVKCLEWAYKEAQKIVSASSDSAARSAMAKAIGMINASNGSGVFPAGVEGYKNSRTILTGGYYEYQYQTGSAGQDKTKLMRVDYGFGVSTFLDFKNADYTGSNYIGNPIKYIPKFQDPGGIYDSVVVPGIAALMTQYDNCLDRYEEILSLGNTGLQGNVFVASGGKLQFSDGLLVYDYPETEGSIVMPDMDYIMPWQERLWGFKGDTLRACGYRDPGDWGGQSASSNLLTGGFLEVRPGDGCDISGLAIYQGDFYVTKANELGGPNGSLWKLTGSSFLSTSADAFTLTLINDDVGCSSPQTMARSLDNIMFYSTDGQVLSQTMLEAYTNPQSVSLSKKVALAFDSEGVALAGCYQPKLGYYFLVLSDEESNESSIWAYHAGTKGWWKWTLPYAPTITAIGTGLNKDVLFGDIQGNVYKLTLGDYGLDGRGDLPTWNCNCSLSFMGITNNMSKDKFFQELYLDYLPTSKRGTMWAEYAEGRGYSYAYSDRVTDYDKLLNNRGAIISTWDSPGSQWDDEGTGWDGLDLEETINRINRRCASLEISIFADSRFKFFGASVTGGIIANKYPRRDTRR